MLLLIKNSFKVNVNISASSCFIREKIKISTHEYRIIYCLTNYYNRNIFQVAFITLYLGNISEEKIAIVIACRGGEILNFSFSHFAFLNCVHVYSTSWQVSLAKEFSLHLINILAALPTSDEF